MRKLITALAAILALAGCASVGTPIDAAKASQIKEGATTRQQVEAWSGPPASATATGDGRTMCLWVYSEASNSAQNFIPVVNIVQSRVNLSSQTLQVFFTPAGVVESFTLNGTTLQGRGGLVK